MVRSLSFGSFIYDFKYFLIRNQFFCAY
uniref:Uncharacterized protein n=1 Tax=Phaeodactylum tricornutum TaxID=2850 RepID=A0A172E711_PHATR|nr:hypothetical protein [Phaeodactylum tricornutum]